MYENEKSITKSNYFNRSSHNDSELCDVKNHYRIEGTFLCETIASQEPHR